MTIKDLAKTIGVSKETYMRMEQNKYDLHNADKLKTLCDILELDAQKICSPYQLFLLNNPGAQILDFRKSHNLSQRELANLLGTDRQAISRYENNINPMPLGLWIKLNYAFKS